MHVKYERQLKRGVFDILVLKLLTEKEKYGYQLISELRDKSGGMFTLKEGTLYPILYRLEDDGFVISHWSKPQGKEVAKKYYQITPDGEQMLVELKTLWQNFSMNVDHILKEEW